MFLTYLSQAGTLERTGGGAMSQETVKLWYALWTRGRHEKKVTAELEERGIECFLPLVRRVRQWSDRRKVVAFPLFPGYLFLRESIDAVPAAAAVQGVVAVLGAGETPVPVSEHEIEKIRRVVQSPLPVDLFPSLPVGQRVRIRFGVLAGVEGVLVQWRGNHRVVVAIDLLRQGAAVTIAPDNVEPL